MFWQNHLTRDPRTFTEYDDVDSPERIVSLIEVSACNYAMLEQHFLLLRDKAKAVLEIGISRNGDKSMTQAFIRNKLDSTIYVGIDIDDKSYLHNQKPNVHTIQRDSSCYEENVADFRRFGVDKFDFIFIDGWHSINQVMRDWEYVRLLADGGIVGFHDTNAHPGPKHFLEVLNRDLWNVNYCCKLDYGIAFATRK